MFRVKMQNTEVATFARLPSAFTLGMSMQKQMYVFDAFAFTALCAALLFALLRLDHSSSKYSGCEMLTFLG